MKTITYFDEQGDVKLDFNNCVILSKHNAPALYSKSAFELHPTKALFFENADIANQFKDSFTRDTHDYRDALPNIDTKFYVVDCTRLKERTYADLIYKRNE